MKEFQSTLPIREETFTAADGSDEKPFQSTLPIREETCLDLRYMLRRLFQSTLPIREETVWFPRTGAVRCDFNPLFPYGKRPLPKRNWFCWQTFQSTLPIREETGRGRAKEEIIIFQSTLPIREETVQSGRRWMPAPDFNPLFPYGKRPYLYHGTEQAKRHISIHSSHTGRDR